MGMSIALLLEELRSGSPNAAQSLWDGYFQRMVNLAAVYIRSRGLQFDEESVAGSALATFVCRARDGQFPNLGDREDLWGLLFVLTIRKIIKRWRKTKRRPERNFSDLNLVDQAEIDEILSAGPDPALVDSLWAELMEGLDVRRRQVAQMKLEGFRSNEIAKRLRISEVTVQRDLRKIRTHWSSSDTEDAAPYDDKVGEH